MYQSVEGLSLSRDMVELRQSNQKMRTNLSKTLDSELELHDPSQRLWVMVDSPSTRCWSQLDVQWRAYHLEETWWSSDNPLKGYARTWRRRWTHNWSSTNPRVWVTPTNRCNSQWRAYLLVETWWSSDNPLKRCARSLRRRWTQNWSSTTPHLWVTPSNRCTSLSWHIS